MSEPTFDSHGNLNIGPVTRNSEGRIAIDFERGNPGNGLVLDVAAPASGRVMNRFGNFYIGQDASGNFVVQDSAGAEITRLGSAGGAPAAVQETAYQWNIPLIIAPTGSIADNGVLTSGTVNPLTYLKTFTFFPADAIAAGVAAGFYYTVWTTTTAATIYNNLWDGASEPTVPASPTAFATTGPGAFTGPTAEALYFTLPMPAAEVGSRYELELQFHQTNNANAKTARVRFTNLAGTVLATHTLTSFLHAIGLTGLHVNGVADKQRLSVQLITAAANARATPALAAEATSAAFSFAVTYEKATATDVGVIESVRLIQSR